jgi:hypothetical protein
VKIPVKDEVREGDPCVICLTAKRALDQLITDLPKVAGDGHGNAWPSAEDIEHVLTAVVRWFMQQALAHTEGDVAKIIGIVQQCLNEPQNNRLVAQHLGEALRTFETPHGPVH